MKKLIALILSVMMVLSFTACKKETEVSGDKVTLKIGFPSGGDITPMEILETFKAENPDIEVIVDEAPWNDYKKKLKIQMSSKDAPDVFITDSGYAAALGAMGAVEDLSGRIEKDLNKDDYSEALFGAKDPNGKVWGVPHGLNALGLFYNKDLFDKAGIEYPTEDWTYEDMFDAARKLTVDLDGDGEIDQYGLSYGTNITEGWLPFILAAGGAPLDETRTKSMFLDPKTKEGLEKFQLPQKEGFAPSLDWSKSMGGVSAFYTDKLAMMLTQSSNINAINTNDPDCNYDVQMVPKGWDGNRYCIFVPNYWMIASRAGDAQKDAAWRWIKHFLSEESQKLVGEKFLAGFPIHNAALKEIASRDAKPESIMQFSKGIDEAGVTMFENAQFEEWRKKVDEWAAKLRQGLVTVDEATKSIDAMLNEVLK